MQIILFILFLLLACVFLWYYRFEKNTGLPVAVIIALFCLKVFAGTLNLYIHFYEFVSNDIGFFYWQAFNELKEMRHDPRHFFYEWLFNWGDIRDGFNFASPRCNVFWKDLGVLIHTKYMTLATIISCGHQYVNVVIYNLPFFIGQLLLYKAFYRQQPEKKWLFVIVIFLVPSVLFWCSGIHKDGWVLTAFGLIFYSLSHWIRLRNSKYLLALTGGLFLLFIVRYFYFIALLPLLILWIFSRTRKYVPAYYAGALLVSATLFFNIHRVLPAVNPMKMVQSRQTEFLGLIGYSDMKTPRLENNFTSYMQHFPTALNHVFLRPSFKWSDPLKYQISAIDNYLVLLLLISLLIFVKRKNFRNGLLLSSFLFAVSMYLFIGYTIPNCGALVRYKSEFTVLLLAAAAGLSEFPSLYRKLNSRLPGSE